MNTNLAIVAAEKELDIRQRAISHLTGIPSIQNASAISRLEDELTHLHIAKYEAEHPEFADCPMCDGYALNASQAPFCPYCAREQK